MDKIFLQCIAYGCPKNNRGEDCPLLELEHLSFKEKVTLIDKLDENTITKILSHHVVCTKSKNKKTLTVAIKT